MRKQAAAIPSDSTGIQQNRTYKNRSVARGQQIMFEGDFPTKLQINVNGDFKLIANETDGEDNF